MWWVPVVIGAVAAFTSYYATWRFKKADVERESAFRSADLVNRAEQLVGRITQDAVAREDLYAALQHARIRAEPLGSSGLDDRFRSALSYLYTLTIDWMQPGHNTPPGARRWAGEAVANIREGLLPYLEAPRFGPIRQGAEKRSFPTLAELNAMPHDGDGQALIVALEAWVRARNR